MLTGVGFAISPGLSVQRLPTLKGRFLLDLARLLTFERRTRSGWSDETRLVLAHLRLDPLDGWQEPSDSRVPTGPVSDILFSVDYAYRQFGIDLMEGVSSANPRFYSEFRASHFLTPAFHGADPSLWEDADDIARFAGEV